MFGFYSFAEAPFASLLSQSQSVTVEVTGVSATALVGSVTAYSPINVTSVQAIGELGNVNVWGIIAPITDPNWVNVNASGGSIWYPVNSAQTPNWIDVGTPEVVTWATVNNSQTPNWTNVVT
jgi:hypothetical protein